LKKLIKRIAICFIAFLIILSFISTISAVHAATSTSTSQFSSLQLSYYAIPSGGRALQIVSGPDNNLWFTVDRTGERSTFNGEILAPVIGSIGRITSEGLVSEFQLPGSTNKYINNYVDSISYAITRGSDGNLWFTEAEANKVGKITPQGDITEYDLPERGMSPRSITVGPDGNIWLMIAGDQESMVISMDTNGKIVKELSVPGINLGQALTFGPDGNLWFRGAGFRSIGRLTTEGIYTEFTTDGIPVEVVSGINNDLWLGLNGGHLTQITTDGVITTHQTPGELAWNIAKDSDNNIWFKDSIAKINKIGPDGGDRAAFALSTSEEYVPANDMVFGQNGNIWFTDNGKIGQIELKAPNPPDATNTPPPGANPDSGNNGYNNNFNNGFNNNYNNGYNNNYNNGYNNGYNNNYNNGYNNGFIK
jgi:virginiamycin B lyase